MQDTTVRLEPAKRADPVRAEDVVAEDRQRADPRAGARPVRLGAGEQTRPSVTPGSLSIDLDTLADYADGYGFEYARKPDPVLVCGLPRFLDLLAERCIRATLFVIGRDLAVPEHRAVIHRAVAEGHELANHTMRHPRQLARLDPVALRDEIEGGHDAVGELQGAAPVGFRAPCYDISTEAMAELRRLDYRYDSSVHPTPVGPLIDLVVMLKSGFRKREVRAGTYAHLLASLRPYAPLESTVWRAGGLEDGLLELPLSALPLCRLPFYGTFAQATGPRVFNASLAWLRRFRIPLNYHFHAVELLDLADPGVDSRFSVHPGLGKPLDRRRADIAEMLDRFRGAYGLVPLAELADRYRSPAVSSHSESAAWEGGTS